MLAHVLSSKVIYLTKYQLMVQDGAVLDASRNPIVDLLTGALLISLGLPSLSPKIVA
jgi:hypothetical protein